MLSHHHCLFIITQFLLYILLYACENGCSNKKTVRKTKQRRINTWVTKSKLNSWRALKLNFKIWLIPGKICVIRIWTWNIKKPHEALQSNRNITKECFELFAIALERMSMECFTADFLQFLTKKCQNCQNLAFGGTAGYLQLNPSISRIFLKFPNFLRSLVLSCLATYEAAHTFTFW